MLRGDFIDTLFTYYSEGPEEAGEQAKSLEAEQGAKRVGLRNFPRGFKIVQCELPGTIEVADND